ncbi:nuclear transport factor 2 family protein [Duganella aceris]|uniref:Nuclear transport factor 2 family protein n=1 Tax=Duganella aceris TaxID=2703883 RepID=A0ABX0FL50_9BURK|nr:nuclear transport factor 2 family protein [Duganella aceris]NGZ85317.1 nuclear transport factor 2 family protein [Duganella aceris]
MKKLMLYALSVLPLSALAAPCLPTDALIARDSQYEEALRVGDVPFLRDLLADEYVWVHTLGSQIETKAAILARSEKPATIYKARTTSEVHAHVQGDTVVLRGLSTVDQWNKDGKTFRSNRYQFLRTYVNVGGACKLLAVQTMKVWSSEAK